MQPLTLPEIRFVESVIKNGLPNNLTSDQVLTLRKALGMALECNEILCKEWAKNEKVIN